MLSKAREGDTIHIVYLRTRCKPSNVKVNKVGRLYLETVDGVRYCRKTGIEVNSGRSRSFVPSRRAWISEAAYREAGEHYLNARLTIRELSELDPQLISPDDLKLLKKIVSNTRKAKINGKK